jgi:hypothetical protein
MNENTTVIVDHGCALFGTYQASFFCKGEITVENIVAEISKRLGVECTTTGYNEEFHSITVIVSRG